MVYKKLFILSIGLVLFIGCKPAKQHNKKYTDCYVFTVNNSTDYEGNDKGIAKIMADFNLPANHKNIDIVRIKIASAYNYEEHVKRMYMEDSKLFITDDSITHTAIDDDYKKFAAFFRNPDAITKNIQCVNSSSSRHHYRYFLKVEGKIVINFSANQNIENIDPALLGNEVKYLEYFESAR